MLPCHVFVMKATGEVAYLNRAASEYFGEIDMTDAAWVTVIHPDDLERMVSLRESIIASRSDGAIEARVRRSDGEYRRIVSYAYGARDESGDFLGWLGITVEIEDMSRLE